MQLAVRFNYIVSSVMSMIKINNDRGQCGVISFANVPISKGGHDGGNGVLLQGDYALMRALNRLGPKGAL